MSDDKSQRESHASIRIAVCDTDCMFIIMCESMPVLGFVIQSATSISIFPYVPRHHTTL